MTKAKKIKKAARSKTSHSVTPDLVTAMMKLVERLGALEQKMDQVSGRVSNLPSEIRQVIQGFQHSSVSHPSQLSVHPGKSFHPQNPRSLYQAVCADCLKTCEVPFKPSGDRPVYCPECWAIRKAGHRPKDIASGVSVPSHLKQRGTVPTKEIQAPVATPKIAVSVKKTPVKKKSKSAVAKKTKKKK
ncbi:MAG: CxxC-x17-CxxC domain-containing protein [Candidatus Omnitrophota bacterium]|jgi:CxxC-x17-CxxC domain-containing protein